MKLICRTDRIIALNGGNAPLPLRVRKTDGEEVTLESRAGQPPDQYYVPVGVYEVERVPSPVGTNCDWLVFKGTQIGGAVGFYTQWSEVEPSTGRQPQCLVLDDHDNIVRSEKRK